MRISKHKKNNLIYIFFLIFRAEVTKLIQRLEYINIGDNDIVGINLQRAAFVGIFLCFAAGAAEAQENPFDEEYFEIDALQNEAFSELDGVIKVRFTDAVDASPIAGAEVVFLQLRYSTDNNGYIHIPHKIFEKITEAKIEFTCKKDGYITLNDHFIVLLGTLWFKNFSLSPEIPLESVRFVLHWGEMPKDLDLHLVCSSWHISYRNKKSAEGKAVLDKDDRNGFGPETITLNKVDLSEDYRIYVYNFSDEAKPDKGSKVYVYNKNRLEKIIELTGSGRFYDICEIKKGQFQYSE